MFIVPTDSMEESCIKSPTKTKLFCSFDFRGSYASAGSSDDVDGDAAQRSILIQESVGWIKKKI